MPLAANRISTAEYTRADLASDGSCENNKPRPSTLTTPTTPRSSPLFYHLFHPLYPQSIYVPLFSLPSEKKEPHA